ncbi:hypothetical protein, partial [Moorena sp. SIO2C4]|uniref:hypothetical protein n=1 Tax=Moorena sp. SIO2C4 TaxID=2607824 RepID=UPI0013CC5963
MRSQISLPDSRLPTPDSRLPTPDSRLPILNSKFYILHSLPPVDTEHVLVFPSILAALGYY